MDENLEIKTLQPAIIAKDSQEKKGESEETPTQEEEFIIVSNVNLI
jgi:hypothetical protein